MISGFQVSLGEWQDHLEGVLETFNQWLWLLGVLGWSAKRLNHPRNGLAYASNCVYPWYILHQTLIIAAAYFVARFSLGDRIEFILVLAATIVGCWTVTEYVIRRQKLLKFLFGMK